MAPGPQRSPHAPPPSPKIDLFKMDPAPSGARGDLQGEGTRAQISGDRVIRTTFLRFRHTCTFHLLIYRPLSNSTRSCGPVLLVSLHSRCRGGQRLPRRPRLLRPLAVSCCVHHGSMGYVHQLQGIEELRRVSAAQVWIAPRQIFDGRAGFKV